MIVNALSELDTELIQADVCVIGSGAAGITLGLGLADTRLKVCVLESGGLELDGTTQSLCEGEVIGLDYFPLDATRLRYFGGTTGHWGGMCGPLQPIDLEVRSWVPLSGWPLRPDELQPFYDRACRVCEIDSTDFTPDALESLIGSKRLPLDPKYLETTVIRYSPPTNFGERYRAALQAANDITVILHANALELQIDEATHRVMRAKCGTTARREFHVESRVYVLATGGIENARILLLSNSVVPEGLGNQNDLVGRYFMEHPHYNCGVLVPEDPERDITLYDGAEWRRKPGVRASCFLSPSAALQREAKLLNGRINLEPVYWAPQPGLADRAEDLMDRIGSVIRRNGMIDVETYHRFFQQHYALDHFAVSCM
jgi:choline dehydrogenase-like flavoprotein